MINKKAKIGSSTKFWFEEFSNIGECQIGVGCTIHSHVWIGDGVIIGNRVRIEAFTFIPPGVVIADDVFIGPRVTFTNDKYPPSKSRDFWKSTIVKYAASIGAGAIILPGIELGELCVIGAGAVVTKSVPRLETWVGNPAHKK